MLSVNGSYLHFLPAVILGWWEPQPGDTPTPPHHSHAGMPLAMTDWWRFVTAQLPCLWVAPTLWCNVYKGSELLARSGHLFWKHMFTSPYLLLYPACLRPPKVSAEGTFRKALAQSLHLSLCWSGPELSWEELEIERMQGMGRRGVCTEAQLLPPLHLCCFLPRASLLLLSRDIPDGSRCGGQPFGELTKSKWHMWWPWGLLILDQNSSLSWRKSPMQRWSFNEAAE